MPSDPLGTTSPILPQILLQVVLILLNALFASAEIAVISCNEVMLRKNAESGDKKSKKLLSLIEEPTKFLATIQIGITLAGFLGSAFAADNFATRFTNLFVGRENLPISLKSIQTLSVIVVTIILSFFTLVLGELVPKRIAMQHPEKIARSYANFIYALAKIMRPVVTFLNFTTNLVLKIFRIDPDDVQEKVTEEEIRAMVDAGSMRGTIEPEERYMIENIFEFNNKTVSEVMVHRSDVDVLWLDETLEDWENTFIGSTHSVLVVCGVDIDDVVGTLNIKKYNAAIKEGVKTIEEIQEYIVKPEFTPEHVTINIAFKNMQLHKTHFLFVLDEYGGVSGIVTIHDLLEEIVGDFDDEDMEAPDIIALSETRWMVRGKTAIYEVNEELNTNIPEGEVDTIGGYIINQLGSFPVDKDVPPIVVGNVRVSIEEMGVRRIEWLIVEKIEENIEDNTEDIIEEKL